MIRLAFALAFLASHAQADTLVAARPIPARHILTAADIELRPTANLQGVTDPGLVIGKETTMAIYAGRPIELSNLVEPAMIERNQIIPLIYRAGALSITTEGRSLDRGRVGERIRVMNLESRLSVSAIVSETGEAIVNP